MTSSVSRMIQKKEDERRQQEYVTDIPMPSQLDKEAENLYKVLERGPAFDPSSASLLTPVVDLPESIQERLGLSVKFLVSKEHQNWPAVLQTLKMGGGFKDLKEKDVRKLIYNIPKDKISSIIPQVESLMVEAKMVPTSKVLNVFINSLALGKEVSPETLSLIESYVETIRASNKGILPRDTYETMIHIYGKANDINKINALLMEMKENNLKPSADIYSNVLKTLVYKSRDHKEAVSIFDSMKFLSQETKPGTNAYKDVIVSYVNNDDVEKALDLYQEMLTSRTPVNQEILVALARGCTGRKQLRFKAWDFIFEIYDNEWSPTRETLEYMVYLSSKDGDVALSRALYKRLASVSSVTKRTFTFLLMSYSKSRCLKPDAEVPAITVHERGRHFRANLLSQADTLPTQIEPKYHVPFLPVLDLASPEEIIAESSAVWAHSLMFNPDFINDESYNTYLNIAAEFGSLHDLMDRYDFSKMVDDAAMNSTRVIIEEPDVHETNTNSETTKLNDLAKSPVFNELSSIESKFNITRSTLTYMIALKGAGILKNYQLSQDVWMERGKYRKSKEFKLLPRKEKDKLDFQFATQMVQSLTKMQLIDDAVAIIVSTEYQFKWAWLQLSPLYQECVELGYDKHCSTLRSIASRAQIRFEGKIRKKDFKEYLSKKRYGLTNM
ncbi:Mitochondrial group I intron splicing factor ccm1 [Yamadazyma tenuis]|nr:Mitochondrial group I intron splicing factor ccm1 [Yamadazyma tenuis]